MDWMVFNIYSMVSVEKTEFYAIQRYILILRTLPALQMVSDQELVSQFLSLPLSFFS